MTGKPTHTAIEERMAPCLSFSPERVTYLSTTEKAKRPLSFVFSYIQPVTQRYNTKRTFAVNAVTT